MAEADRLPNTGVEALWKEITKDGNVAVLNDADTGDMLDRRALLESSWYAELLDDGLELERVAEEHVMCSSDSVYGVGYACWVVEMWGYKSMRASQDPFPVYENAVQNLVRGIEGFKGMAAIMDAHKFSSIKDVVLHVGGEPACYGQESELFSHVMMAPFVASLLREELGPQVFKIHLVITSCSTAAVKDLLGWVVSDTEAETTSINIQENIYGKNFYPGVRSGVFDSCTVIARNVEGDTRPPVIHDASLLSDTLGSRALGKFCLCVGGTNRDSVQALIEDNAKKYEAVVFSRF